MTAMSANYDEDDFARLLALEYGFEALTLISAVNYAQLAGTKPSAAVSQFRSAIEGAFSDNREIPTELRDLMRQHIKRMFDHVTQMAAHADLGYGDQSS